LRRYDGLLRTMSLTPTFGGRMPLCRPPRTSWNTKGSHITGTSPMYSTAGRPTTKFPVRLISFALK